VKVNPNREIKDQVSVEALPYLHLQLQKQRREPVEVEAPPSEDKMKAVEDNLEAEEVMKDLIEVRMKIKRGQIERIEGT